MCETKFKVQLNGARPLSCAHSQREEEAKCEMVKCLSLSLSLIECREHVDYISAGSGGRTKQKNKRANEQTQEADVQERKGQSDLRTV